MNYCECRDCMKVSPYGPLCWACEDDGCYPLNTKEAPLAPWLYECQSSEAYEGLNCE